MEQNIILATSSVTDAHVSESLQMIVTVLYNVIHIYCKLQQICHWDECRSDKK